MENIRTLIINKIWNRKRFILWILVVSLVAVYLISSMASHIPAPDATDTTSKTISNIPVTMPITDW